MKTKLIIAAVAVMLLLVVADYRYNDVQSSSVSPPAGVSGSPADGYNCGYCHIGSAVTSKEGWITSNIGPQGYVPGMTYTFTATASKAGGSKFGFQVSPQSSNGTVRGTLILTNPTATQLLGQNKYISHTGNGNLGSGSRAWSFQWKAPTAGSGSVTFYGAFNCSNNDGTKYGDLICTSSYTVKENTTGIESSEPLENTVSIYPNPSAGNIHLGYTNTDNCMVVISLYDLSGKKLADLSAETTSSGIQNRSIDLTGFGAGVYFIAVTRGEQTIFRKVIIL